MLIRDHHPGYITWDAYLANEQRLAKNHTRQGQRPPREGSALCQGIVRCGACGHSMSVQYRAKGAHYDCSASRMNRVQTPGCRSVKAAGVDELVARRLLAALTPAQIAVALAAADEVADRRARSHRAVELRVERARYDAARAERAFHACEPENRLVARSLETRWEQKLRELADAETELAEQTTPAPEPSREQLEALARDVPALWAADSTTEKDRKRLLRAVITDVTITSQPDSPDVAVGIRWRTGAAEQHTIQRPPSINDRTRTPPAIVELITRLVPGRTNTEIADQLNTAGLRTGKGLPFNDHAVRHIRRAHNIPATPLPHDDRLTVEQVAGRLNVSPGVIYDWISHGKLTADRDRTNRAADPVRPRHRAGMPAADRELQPHPSNQNRRYRRCSLMPAFPGRRSGPRRGSSGTGGCRRARRGS